jgi:hypothetical protein
MSTLFDDIQKYQERRKMAEPLDAVMAIHNAFRRDMSEIDAAALDSARGKPGLAPKVKRFRFFNEVLVWHAHGEELAIFPALEAVAPSVAEAYERDHRGLDAAFNALNAAVSAHDALDTARATAVFKFHLDIHLGKEDAHLYRLVRERVPMADPGQGSRSHGKHRAAGAFPRAGCVDVPFDGQRRPREHDPYLANGDASSSIRGSQAAHPKSDRQ